MLNINDINENVGFDMLYADEFASHHGAYVVKRPDIPTAEENVTFIDIPGRNGSLTKRNHTFKDVSFKVDLNFLADCGGEFREVSRDIKAWLLHGTPRELSFTDDANAFLKVKSVSIGDVARIYKRKGTLSPTFTVEAFEYFRTGQMPVTDWTTIRNQWYTSEPLYIITGNGTATLNVNGETMTVEVVDGVILDVGRMIAYRASSSEIVNSDVTGNYDALKLQNGINVITLTSGFTMSVIPNWRSVL